MVGCGQGEGFSDAFTDRDIQAIDDLRNAFVAAESRGDWRAQAALYTRDAALLEEGRTLLTGRGSIRAALDEFNIVLDSFALESQEVSGGHNIAYDRGTYSLEFRERLAGQKVRRSGQYLMVLRRVRNRSWRIAALIHSPDAGPSPRVPIQ